MVSFILQLPVSVYESVIDIINGEVLLLFHIINTSFPAAVIQFPIENELRFIWYVCLLFLIEATMLFAELTYTLATEEAERIGVDHVARMTATGTGENSTGKRGCC